jgi:hypothetical protein
MARYFHEPCVRLPYLYRQTVDTAPLIVLEMFVISLNCGSVTPLYGSAEAAASCDCGRPARYEIGRTSAIAVNSHCNLLL